MLEVNKFNAIRIRLASPEQVRSWSYGEVIKPETINYRTLKPERDGLFCERIFGPTKDWECSCGKYKKIRYRGIICDKCGVEVTRSRVRRERMGHIELAAPVTHIWFLKGTPSRIGQILDITPRDLEKIVYFASFIVTEFDEAERDAALGRIDDDLAARETEIQAELAQRAEDLEADTAEQIAKLDEQLEGEIARLQEEAETTVARLTPVAESGSNAEEEIRLSWLDEPVIAAGHAINAESLAAIEAAAATAVASANERFGATKLARRREADQEAMGLEEERASQIAGTREFYQQRADDLTTLELHQLLSEPRYQQLSHTCGEVFGAGIGAEAVVELIGNVDLDALAAELREEIESPSIQRRKKATKRLKVVEAFRRSGNRPEWMILSVLPVLPPDIRPMVQLDGGRFATSDLNDLYRRVINRNNRLKRLVELGAPEIIVRNEKRMLQEAVDALIDNGRRGRAVTGSSNHPYKSLSDQLRGKQGRFRQNLLGKRVDYSGRSVIVVGPHLKLNQCGLPTKMALELFKPFVMRKLVDYGHASNIKSAKRMVEHPEPVVWDALAEVTQDHPVLLNRAPTLHRLGIQAFDIVLVTGSAIQIHPLVCTAFNADFDGDQMAVHVPLSRAAQDEARYIMKSTLNVLSPADGAPIIAPTKDMALGAYYLTEMVDGAAGEDRTFADFADALLAFEHGAVHLHAKIKLRVTAQDFPVPEDEPPSPAFIETTIGRIIFNIALPRDLRFVNERLDKGGLRRVLAGAFFSSGIEATAEVADRVKDIGMYWATRSGVTMGVFDLEIPAVKDNVLAGAEADVAEIERSFKDGFITDRERYKLTVQKWTEATEKVTAAVPQDLDPHGPVFMMGNSGAAKGNFDQIRQVSGMRGLMSDPTGKIYEVPVRGNFREGLTVLEYFISTHGARKGLADTALRTADSGYLTRRLVDVAQDVIVMGEDCGATEGDHIVTADPEQVEGSVGDRAFGRFTLAPVVHPETGEIIVPADVMVDRHLSRAIDDAGVGEVFARSVMHCRNARGVCQRCYGMDLARHELVEEGAAVGIIAAQSMGEPATQLTMRTFHLGGVVMGTDITDRVQGLPRVEELFEARVPKGVAQMSALDGTAEIIEEEDRKVVRVVSAHIHEQIYELAEDFVPIVEDGDEVAKDATLALPREQAEDLLARKAKSKSKTISKRALASVAGAGPRATNDGVVSVRDGEIVLRSQTEDTDEYPVSPAAELQVRSGQLVSKGQQLTAGPLNPQDILRLRGREALQRYVVQQVQSVYRIVGVAVNDKHIEVIVRQMLRRVHIEMPGDTDMLPGTLIDRHVFDEANEHAVVEDRRPATARPVLLGVTKASLNNESFLAAASFQDTTRVLTEAVVEGKTDHLHGLKENVIIGKLIPAGTGWKRYHEGTLITAGEGDAESLLADDGEGEGVLAAVGSGAEAADDGEGRAIDSLMQALAGEGDDDRTLLAGIPERPSAAADQFSAFLSSGADEPIEEANVQDVPLSKAENGDADVDGDESQ